jgi:hypothetical protein
MLSKLIKYELKATGRIFFPIFLSLLLFSVINRIITPLGPEEFNTPAAISMAIYFAIMAGMFAVAFIMMIQRFYKNLLANEGYLMHTLPVKPWKHIISKLLVSILWIVTSGVVAVVSIMVITLRKGSLTVIAREISTLYEQASNYLGSSMYLWLIEILIGIFIAIASGILLVYASMAIGQLFYHHKLLASFGAFIVLNTLSQIYFAVISTLHSDPLFVNLRIIPNNFLEMQPMLQLAIAYAIFLTALLCAAFFWLTNYILSKRLNLE